MLPTYEFKKIKIMRKFTILLVAFVAYLIAVPLSAQNDATINATVWDDRNANSIKNGTEPGIDGVTVELYTSSNSLVSSTTTTSGLASFTGVSPGTYYLKFYEKVDHKFTPKTGSPLTDDHKSDANVSGNGKGKTGTFTVASGQTINYVDAGMWAPGTVKATVWDDRNANKMQNGNEPKIPNVFVHLLDDNNGDAVLQTVQTDANGVATFTGVPADRPMKLKFDLPADHRFTPKAAGNITDNDKSDPNESGNSKGKTGAFSIAKGSEVITYVDAGLWAPGTVKATVWDDRNANKMQNGNEPKIPNVFVHLLDDNNGDAVLQTVQTDANGVATFTGVPADRPMKLKFDLPADHRFTPKAAGNITDNDKSDPNESGNSKGKTGAFSIAKGSEVITYVDAGLWAPGTVKATVWDDRNANKMQNGNEPKIKDVWVHLLDDNDNDKVLQSVQTDQSGVATFTNVPADRPMKLKFDLPDDHRFTPKTGDPIADDNKSDANQSGNSKSKTGAFSIAKGSEVITYVDAGMWAPGLVRSQVFFDNNSNGIKNGNEDGLFGFEVSLLELNKSTVEYPPSHPQAGQEVKGTTDCDGFVDLYLPADRDVYLFVKANNGAVFTTKAADIKDDNKSDPNVSGNARGRTAQFGAEKGSHLINYVDAGIVAVGNFFTADTDNDNIPDFMDKYPSDNANNGLGAIYSRAWNDRDGNGRQGSGEEGVGCVSVKLKKGGSTLGTAVTNPIDGGVAFFDIALGQNVYLDYSKPNSDWAYTTKDANSNNKDNEDSDVNRNDGKTSTFNVGNTNVITKWDAGFWAPGSIIAYVWDDQDGNGRQGSNEPAVKGVTVKLKKGGSTLSTKTTNKNGEVNFMGIVPADQNVYLDFDIPAGYAYTVKDANSNNKDLEDSDANRTDGITATFKTTKGSHLITKWDAGVWAPGSVKAYVWDDQDGNGRQGSGEPAVKDVSVKLKRGGSTLGTVLTDANGEAFFDGIVPADVNVYLDFDIPAGYAYTVKDANSNNKDLEDSDANRTDGKTATFKTTKGSHLITKWDAGVWAPGSVKAYVWDDQDGNGRQGSGEPAVKDVSVKLKRGGSTLGTVLTDANGEAFFDGIVPADVSVYLDFDIPAGYAYTVKDANSNNKDLEDSDANRTDGKTATFKTTKGSHLITRWDAGVWAPGSVKAYVWEDTDGNGRQGGSEPAVQGVEVKLKRGGSTLGTVSTDANGEAFFDKLVPADVNVYLDFSLPSGYAYTIKDANSNNKDLEDSDANLSDGKTDQFKTNKGSELITKWDAGLVSEGIGPLVLHSELTDFDIRIADEGNQLLWETATEIQSDYFSIERSMDGVTFIPVGSVSAAGNSTTDTKYTFVDSQQLSNITYYRLKMVDKDGSYDYSDIKSVNIMSGFDYTIFPNPVSDILRVNIQGEVMNDGIYQITDMNGRVYLSQRISGPQMTIDVAQIPGGNYVLTLIGNDTRVSTKVLIVH
jgi:protocatechuate 3,4-dioxygenase beta subunit